MATTTDVSHELARALRLTRKELNELDDLAEQLLQAAQKVIHGHPTLTGLAELQHCGDRILAWQVSDSRTESARLRARVMGEYRELNGLPT